jgi:hypothetical protein
MLHLLTDKIDFTHNYMLPVKIADASGQTISGNFGVAYFHLIGNPIAGSYTHEWLRWNGQTGAGTGPPTFDEYIQMSLRRLTELPSPCLVKLAPCISSVLQIQMVF